MGIIVSIIVKLLSMRNAMYRTFIVIIVIIVKKIDIKTKKTIDIGTSPECILYYILTIMTIKVQGVTFLLDNNYDNSLTI